MITGQSIWGSLVDNANNNVFEVNGTGAPTNGTSGTGAGICGPGSTYTNLTTGDIYINVNTLLSPLWALASGASILQKVTGSITAAAIIATTAGGLGHANGVVLQAAPGASVGLMPVALAMHYTFGVAAYTAGGNITLNWGAGGAALTGLVSAANSLGAASSKSVMFFPLSTAGIAVVSNASLNLVSSAAFTNPGTATGTVFWELWFRTMAVGF